MDETDLRIASLLTVLANIVNRASGQQSTSADAVPIVKVPVTLIYQARRELDGWLGTEYRTEDIEQACKRTFSPK